MRKKFLFIVLLLIGIAAIYIYLEEVSFSPLKEKEFQMLFPHYTGSSKKVCSVEFIGLSPHDELFEFYSYKTSKVSIDTTYPKFVNEWERQALTKATLISKWKSCPIDTVAMKLYEFTLTANNLDENKCLGSFSKELSNPNNYYAYVYFNELEDYFLLYCSEREHLYYIRRKGF